MRMLLDTHIFLWYISGDPRLPAAMNAAIADTSNAVFLSVVSIWECLVKERLGKLPLPAPPAAYLTQHRVKHQIETLYLDESSVSRLPSLPDIHRDPFDRILVCQCLNHDLIMVTVDDLLRKYPAPTFPLGE
ncbi:MAG: type II toxin-antitoxin system VapC family toxin [Candidatus Hydrogenedentes bacterium]|nr:type II toxin-antitoxin system VapC family toxin [Candidatus Hydrogenedentota bacterium]